jgi:hypothetical protein
VFQSRDIDKIARIIDFRATKLNDRGLRDVVVVLLDDVMPLIAENILRRRALKERFAKLSRLA